MFERLHIHSGAIHPTIWYNYRDNVILDSILFRYFEYKTVRKFREPKYSAMSYLVTDYLSRCCEAIITKIELSPPQETDIDFDFDQLIRNELRDLILKIVTLSSVDKQEHDSRLFPYHELRQDGFLEGNENRF